MLGRFRARDPSCLVLRATGHLDIKTRQSIGATTAKIKESSARMRSFAKKTDLKRDDIFELKMMFLVD